MCRNKLVRGIYKIEDLAKRLEGFIDPNNVTDWQSIRESLCAVPIDTTVDGDLMSFVPPVSYFRSKGLLGKLPPRRLRVPTGLHASALPATNARSLLRQSIESIRSQPNDSEPKAWAASEQCTVHGSAVR